jgi:predicted metal-dependent peptidase
MYITQENNMATAVATRHDIRKFEEKLITARVGLLLRHSFFGNLATRLRMVDCTDDPHINTAATDGRHFYFDTKFIDKLSPKQTEFLFCHEVLHNVFDHMGRRGTRDPDIWNIAADYAINQILVDDKIGDKITQVKIFQDNKYRGKSAEEIYDIIFNKYDLQQLQALGELLDQHLEQDGDGDPDKDGKSKRQKYSKEELRKIRDEMKEAMISAAQSAGAGNIPAGVRRMISELTEPKIDWRELLKQQIQSTIRNDYTWMRPSRKGWHTGAILPGMNYDQTIDVAVAIDMSGSITNKQGQDFLSEIKGIMDQFKDFSIKLWCFDTEVYNVVDITADTIHEFENYELKGGGGTDFDANWKMMKDENFVPKKFIMFTDGMPWSSWGDPDYCDTVFIIHGSDTIKPPFGVYSHYEFKG